MDRRKDDGDRPSEHSVRVACVIVNDERKVQITKCRDDGHREPPTRVLELDETFQKGVRRDVLEVTGLPVDVNALMGLHKNMKPGILVLVLKCPAMGGILATRSRTSLASGMTPWRAAGLTDTRYSVRIADPISGGGTISEHMTGPNMNRSLVYPSPVPI